MAVKIWRCIICGDSYVGEDKPSHCPFCGAHAKNMILAKNWTPKEGLDIPIKNLTEKSKKNVEAALQLEISNSAFYFCSAEKCKDVEGKAMFKVLGKVEAEHASMWKKILQLSSINIAKADTCPVEYIDELQESHDRESNAIKHYAQFRDEAVEPRLKQLFQAIVEVETDHLGLSEERGIKK
ncbi:MAG: ferritin family protein [Nanoarchaeota archaeon]|nr:ferritin family protein [Nanoarchaeota archaeon]